MKILQVAKFYPPHPGGMETYVQQISEALATAHRVEVVAFSDSRRTECEVLNGVRIKRCGTPATFGSQPLSMAYIRAVRSIEPDIIHVHLPNPLAAFALAGVARSTPVVVTHHADIPRRFVLAPLVRRVQRQLMSRSAAVICLSRKLADNAMDLKELGIPVAVIPHGVDERVLDATPNVSSRAAAIRSWRKGDERLLAFVGRLVSYKGIDVLLQACAMIPMVRLLIVGEGPERSSLEALAKRLGVADRSHFLGRVSDPERAAVLHACDVFCLPSTTSAEAFGISQVEAQLCGKPVIASRLDTGVTDVAIDGVTALCFEPGNPADLARVIGRICGDPLLANRIAAAGLAHSSAHYTRMIVQSRVLELFDRVARGADHSPFDRLAAVQIASGLAPDD